VTEYEEPRRGRFGRWFWSLGILLTLVMLYIWLSNENVETYLLVQDGGEVSVHKGVYAPWGHSPFAPTGAFSPIRTDADVAVRPGPCADLSDCEARLYDIAVTQARRLLGRPDQLSAARDLISQARKLSGRGDEEQLLELQGDEQYALGVGRLEEVGRLLLQARRNFARAQAMDAGTFRDGRARVDAVDALLSELRDAGVRVPEPPPSRSAPAAAPKPSGPAAPAPEVVPAQPTPKLQAVPPVQPAQPETPTPGPPVKPQSPPDRGPEEAPEATPIPVDPDQQM
jgi:hypothetical protein